MYDSLKFMMKKISYVVNSILICMLVKINVAAHGWTSVVFVDVYHQEIFKRQSLI